MKKIKIKFTDFWEGFEIEKFYLYKVLKEKYEVTISDKPDYLIFSCYGNEHLKYNCIKIYYTGENLTPDFNLCDYAIGFDYLTYEDRYIRYPLYLMYETYLDTFKKIINRKLNKVKYNKKFCNMVVSNKNFDLRNDFYKELSKYKKIDSGGKYLNNIGYRVKDKLQFQKKYKFSLAFENSSKNGYLTEKIFDAFAADTIPIYYGDPTVTELINPNTFILVKSKEDFKKAIKLIEKIDQNDKLYEKYFKEDIIINKKYINDMQKKFKNFIYNIFDQNIEDAKRFTTDGYNKYYTQYQDEANFCFKFKFIKPFLKIRRIGKYK